MALKVGDKVLIRDDSVNFTGEGVLRAIGRGTREVEYTEQGVAVKGVFNSTDIKA